MTAVEAMKRLDALVAGQAPESQYHAAKALYEASLAGLLRVPISADTMYGWVFKWATLPKARGTRGRLS